MRRLLPLLLLFLAACSQGQRLDFGGGGTDAQVQMLQDRPSVELSLWEGAIPFDLRDYNDWVQGHIPGARTATLEDLRKGRGLPEDKNAPLLFLGDGPLDTRPEQAAEIALGLGFTNVQLFPGGWRAWIGAFPLR